MNRLDSFRDFYARLVGAFRAVPREKFVGEGPWSAFTPTGYVPTLTDDPAVVYQDITLKLPGVEGPTNNGQPSLHAACLAALSPAKGETGVHVGAGTGYYTAILAELVGPEGSVIAYEIETPLADQAKRNLSSWPQATVECRSGVAGSLPQTDFIYVNAGATHPDESWLSALNANGRLLFPLTPSEGVGGMLLLRKAAKNAFNARFVCPAMFISCAGARNDVTGAALTDAFRSANIWAAASFRLGSRPGDDCCFAAETWWLSTSPV